MEHKPVVVDLDSFSTKVGIAGQQPVQERTLIVHETQEEKDASHYGERAVETIHKLAANGSRSRTKRNPLEIELCCIIVNSPLETSVRPRWQMCQLSGTILHRQYGTIFRYTL